MPHRNIPLAASSLEAFLNCRTKSYLKIHNTIGHPSDFGRHTAVENDRYREHVYSNLLEQHEVAGTLRSPPITLYTLRKGKSIILDANAQGSSLSATIDALRLAPGTSLLGNFHYQPIQFCYHDAPTKVSTLLLAFNSLVIGELQGHIPTHGTVIYGPHLTFRKVQLSGLQQRVRRLIVLFQPFQDSKNTPPLVLNQHCSVCEFRSRCRDEAVTADNLSLLGGMTEHEIAAHNRKGIFTVNQLSYTFRYRKPSKRAKRPAKPHQFSLQALALRTQKVHVHGTPHLAAADPAIYFDIEGLSNPDSYYLIGILIVKGTETEYRSFWADSEREQASIFEAFTETVAAFPNAHLFHYGSYDATALKRVRHLCGPQYRPRVETIIKASTNVLTLITSQIYFPLHSNSLKGIASYLGFKWTDPNATGIQSIIWREKWRHSNDPAVKHALIAYNRDDCMALKTTCDFIRSTGTMGHPLPSSGTQESPMIRTQDLAKPSRRWGRPTFVLKDLERASQCAYFDYQRERVFIRTNRRIADVERAKNKKGRVLRANKCIDVTCRRCIYCSNRNIKPRREAFRRIVDLRFSPGGVRRWVGVSERLKTSQSWAPQNQPLD